MRFLRQSTASQEILLGPFVATADGTAQTGLTIANTDIKLLLGGATSEQNKNSGGGTHIAGGRYSAVLDATDTATVGILEVSVAPASGIPWNKTYYVLEEAVYDAFFAASALGYVANAPVNVAQFGGSNGTFASGRPEVNSTHWAGTAVGSTTVRADLINIAGAAVSTTTAQLGVNAVQISGDGTAADNLETAFDDTAGAVRWLGITDQGTAQAATGTTLQLRAAAAFADDELIGQTVTITGGSTGVGQSRLITDYVSATDTATVDTWTTTPTGTITYRIFPTAPSTGGSGLDAAGVRAAIGMASANLDTQLSTIDTVVDAILVDTGTTLDGRIPAALVSGRMDCSVGAMAANTMTAAAASADLTTELQSGLATAAALATVDTVVDAIKVQTDKFTNLPTFTEGGTGGQGFGAP